MCPSRNQVTCGLGQLSMGGKSRMAACPSVTTFRCSSSGKSPISVERNQTLSVPAKSLRGGDQRWKRLHFQVANTALASSEAGGRAGGAEHALGRPPVPERAATTPDAPRPAPRAPCSSESREHADPSRPPPLRRVPPRHPPLPLLGFLLLLVSGVTVPLKDRLGKYVLFADSFLECSPNPMLLT